MRNRSQTHAKGQPVRLSTLPKLRTKVWLEHDGAFIIGESGLDLLNAIDRVRSLTGAARAVGWSYRHAWGYLRNAEQQLGVALVVTSPGKGSERGTMLSEHGRTVLRRLERASRVVMLAARRGWR